VIKSPGSLEAVGNSQSSTFIERLLMIAGRNIAQNIGMLCVLQKQSQKDELTIVDTTLKTDA
jgi:hypothetical protein